MLFVYIIKLNHSFEIFLYYYYYYFEQEEHQPVCVDKWGAF